MQGFRCSATVAISSHSPTVAGWCSRSPAPLTATEGGVRGMIDDYLVCTRPWGFDPADVTAEIHVWHGARDPLVPLEHALQLAVTLPGSALFVAADEGHHFFRRRLPEILAKLVGREAVPAGLRTAPNRAA